MVEVHSILMDKILIAYKSCSKFSLTYFRMKIFTSLVKIKKGIYWTNIFYYFEQNMRKKLLNLEVVRNLLLLLPPMLVAPQ